MLAAILAAVLAATSPEGTLYTADGGRVRGSLVEAGPAGVTLKLSDGSTRRFAPADVKKVVFADGSQWRPGDPPPVVGEAVPAVAAAPAAAVAAGAAAQPASPAAAGSEAAPPAQGQVAGAGAAPAGVAAVAAAPALTPSPPPPGPMLIPAERLDTVFLATGGRTRALVTEESAEGVVVRLVDGTERRFAPGQVVRIAYADGTVSERPAPPK